MAIVVRNTDSSEIVAELLRGGYAGLQCYRFSPDGRFIAGAVDKTIYVWDIAGSHLRLVETLTGHAYSITSLRFSSSLIATSHDRSVKFWQTCALSTDPVATRPKSMPLTSTPIKSVTLRAKDGIAISSDSDGVVKTWDISTGICRKSFQTPAKGRRQGDAQLIDDVLIFIWWADERIHIWDAEKGELIRTVNAPGENVMSVRISGDGSRVFCLDKDFIRARLVSTGEIVGEVKFGHEFWRGYLANSLAVDDSRVWFRSMYSCHGWDFGIPDLSPVPLLKSDLDSIQWNPRIEDTVTGKKVLQLPRRFTDPFDAQWDDRYMVAGYESGEVLILDFSCVLPQ
jgi:WD40 repeat protein